MTEDNHQTEIARAKTDDLRVAISDLRCAPLPEGLSAEMREMQLAALEGMLSDLEVELARLTPNETG